ncbi:hypothetical protein EYF80_059150 [Liparis tanakae]|uniref:Uncharacterized protein n=1 Tax=Liparis tanakae TaxID=230148 RepID=A0A4Z2EPF1_9TELE|nr:hypothetical protein EYF80_059150 [Liparis tanakae]
MYGANAEINGTNTRRPLCTAPVTAGSYAAFTTRSFDRKARGAEWGWGEPGRAKEEEVEEEKEEEVEEEVEEVEERAGRAEPRCLKGQSTLQVPVSQRSS